MEEYINAYKLNWNFFCLSEIKSTIWKRQIISTCFFVPWGHFDNGTLYKVTYNFYLKIHNILELTTCPGKFGTTWPSVIFLLVTGSRGGSQNLERRNVERPVFRNFGIANIKIKKDELFDNFIFE